MSDGTGHPRHHGFAQCTRCGTHRPRGGLTFTIVYAHGDAPTGRVLTDEECNWVCVDREWCDTQCGKATGLDEQGDAK